MSKNIDFTQWESTNDSRALLLCAPPGHGTTEVCSHVVSVAREKASQTNGSVLYFFCSSVLKAELKAELSTILTHTLLHQIVCYSSDGKANSIAAAFLSTLLSGHFQRHSQDHFQRYSRDFRVNDPLDKTVEKILNAPDKELVEALAEAIKKAGIQELSIVVDGLQVDIACWLFKHIREATPKSEFLLTSRHPFGQIPDGMSYIEYDKERKGLHLHHFQLRSELTT
jgi:hypothetical protein